MNGPTNLFFFFCDRRLHGKVRGSVVKRSRLIPKTFITYESAIRTKVKTEKGSQDRYVVIHSFMGRP